MPSFWKHNFINFKSPSVKWKFATRFHQKEYLRLVKGWRCERGTSKSTCQQSAMLKASYVWVWGFFLPHISAIPSITKDSNENLLFSSPHLKNLHRTHRIYFWKHIFESTQLVELLVRSKWVERTQHFIGNVWWVSKTRHSFTASSSLSNNSLNIYAKRFEAKHFINVLKRLLRDET